VAMFDEVIASQPNINLIVQKVAFTVLIIQINDSIDTDSKAQEKPNAYSIAPMIQCST